MDNLYLLILATCICFGGKLLTDAYEAKHKGVNHIVESIIVTIAITVGAFVAFKFSKYTLIYLLLTAALWWPLFDLFLNLLRNEPLTYTGTYSAKTDNSKMDMVLRYLSAKGINQYVLKGSVLLVAIIISIIIYKLC